MFSPAWAIGRSSSAYVLKAELYTTDELAHELSGVRYVVTPGAVVFAVYTQRLAGRVSLKLRTIKNPAARHAVE